MLRVVLVDDEPLARERLRTMLAGLPGIVVAGEASSAAAGAAEIADTRPDAVFLDVRMPRGDGFSLLEGLAHPPKVVFVTAHAEHAVRAFDVDAVDFLLKPVRRERLAAAVERLREACGRPASPPALLPVDSICLRVPGRTIVASLPELITLEADGDFTRIRLANRPPLMLCRKLLAFERELPSPPFARLDRSLMVNLTRFDSMARGSRDSARLWLRGLDEPVELGRAAQKRLREALGGG